MVRVPALSRHEARARASLVSNVAYDVDLSLAVSDEHFVSTTVVSFDCALDGASTFLDLTAEAVVAVDLNGTLVDGDAFDGHRIWLTDLAERNVVRVVARCSFTTTGSGLHRMVDPVDGRSYTRTHFEPFDAHRVYACFDQPDIRARFTLSVSAHEDWVVISNEAGALRNGRWRFNTTPPISTYLTLVVAGPYHTVHDEHDGLPMALHCRQSLVEHLDEDEIFRATKAGLHWFAELFGHPYPFSKYDQAFVPDQTGAMEHAGCVTFGDDYLYRGAVTELQRSARTGTIYHEMAHMWFGNLVTIRWWDELWLKESFATHLSPRAMVEAGGHASGWLHFNNGRKQRAYVADQLPTTHPIVADIPDTESLRLHYDGITYSKGAAVLGQLVHWLGKDDFERGLRDFIATNAWDAATFDDMCAALQRASDRPVTDWASAWLETAGLTTLRLETTVADEGTITQARIVQEAHPVSPGSEPEPSDRPHRLAIGLYDVINGRLTRTGRVEAEIDAAVTEIPDLVGVALPDLLLVNDDDLTYARVLLDAMSLATLREHLRTLEDPIVRCLCWNAAWETMRAGALPPEVFAEMVVEHAPDENDLGVLRRLLDQMIDVADRWVITDRRRGLLETASKAFGTALAGSQPGSDRQRILALAVARTTSDASRLDTWLSGHGPPGLEMDVDLRWELLHALVTLGEADQERIDAEAARDATAAGQRRSLAMRAALPLTAAKQWAWDAATTGVDLDLRTRAAIGRALLTPGQAGITAEHALDYLAWLPTLWATEPEDIALTLTRALFPESVVDGAVVDAIDQTLTDNDLPAPARRILIEGRHELAIALTVRSISPEGLADDG